MKIIGKVKAACEVKAPGRALRVLRLEYDVPGGRAWAHLTDSSARAADAIKVELPCCIERIAVRDLVEVLP
jgi:hypothetical protein